jgi:hypothetical protein
MTRLVQGDTPMSKRIRVTASINGFSPMIQPTRRPVASVLLKVPSSTAPLPAASENIVGCGSGPKLISPYASSWMISTPWRPHSSTTCLRRSSVSVAPAGLWKLAMV